MVMPSPLKSMSRCFCYWIAPRPTKNKLDMHSNYDSVTAVQSDLGIRLLKQRRVDASVIMLNIK